MDALEKLERHFRHSYYEQEVEEYYDEDFRMNMEDLEEEE